MRHADPASTELLIISRSGRALAASARRSGYACTVIDEYGDQDTRALSRVCRPCPDWSGEMLLAAAGEWRQRTPEGVIVAGSGFEHAPEWLNELSALAPLAAPPPETVSLLKDPARFFSLLEALNIPYPPVVLSRLPDTAGPWLSKPVVGEGGVDIHDWTNGQPVATGHYLQKRIDGTPASVVFLADGCRSRLIGFNICGHRNDWRFSTVVRFVPDNRLAQRLESTIGRIVAETGLQGLCGLDFILQADRFQVLEINPRPPASFELHEGRTSLLAAHIRACLDQQLPAMDSDDCRGCPGKQILYSPTAMTMPAGFEWPAWTADRPMPGARLLPEAPLCTVFARGSTPEATLELLQKRLKFLIDNIQNRLQLNEYDDKRIVCDDQATKRETDTAQCQ